MKDRIHITDLAASCIIGINPEERVSKQEVRIDLTLDCDLSRAAASDDIADTVDYVTLKNRVMSFVEQSEFFLIEKLTHGIAEVCLSDRRVHAVRVRLDKPGALTFARSVGVEIYRTQPDGAAE